MPASHANEDEALTPGLSYADRAEAVRLAEIETHRAHKHERRSFWESLVTWIALIAVAWLSEQTLAALSSIGWLMFVGMYYMPNARKSAARAREILKIRVAFLTVEDSEKFVQDLPVESIAYQMIEYRKRLPSCPM